MKLDRSGGVLKPLRMLFSVGKAGDLTDGQLLARVAAGPDAVGEAAFAVLVERHGPMVLRICRESLGNAHDAQDAFQATFLVFARRAASIRRRDSVGSWLFGVAARVSARAKVDAARRRAAERRLAGRKAPHLPDVRGEQSWPELYEEVERLPESYRAPVVLCYLEGRTYAEAAGQLCWPIGTLKVRLLRARRLLRSRLSRRGVTLSAGALTASLSSGTSAASVPSSLVESTARLALQFAADPAAVPSASTTVAALSKEVLRIMLMSKLKLTLVIVLAGIVASPGLTLAARQLADAGGGAAQPTPALHVVEPPRDEPAEKGNAQVAEDVKEKNKAVLVALSKQTPQDLPAESTLEALLKQLRVSTQGPGIPNGVPIYVDPSGLQEAVATLDASLKIVRKDTGIGTMLRLSLEPLGLVYAVKDGLVVISSADDLEPRMIGSDPRSLAIVGKLKEDIEIRLPTKPRLDDLLRQIRKVTQGAGENGIPIYVDPDGLTEAGVSLDSAIPDNAQGKGPIKLLLRRSLKPLGLSYAVKDGLLMISSPGGIEQYRRDEGR